MARATGSGTISFGMVSIGVKLYTARQSEQVSFSWITPQGNRVKQQLVDAVTGEVVDRKECLKGFEHAKNQFVTFTTEEIKALEAERTNLIDLVEFVPLDSVDLLGAEKTHYLGPDKGSDRAYLLLAHVMREQNKVAVGRWSARGKELLVIIRPYQGGLVLHQMFYANEIRSFQEIEDTIAKFDLSERELKLAGSLVDQLSVNEFEPGKYRDEYFLRVNSAVQQKLAGESVTTLPTQAKTDIIDLFDALKASIKATKKTSRRKSAVKKRTA